MNRRNITNSVFIALVVLLLAEELYGGNHLLVKRSMDINGTKLEPFDDDQCNSEKLQRIMKEVCNNYSKQQFLTYHFNMSLL